MNPLNAKARSIFYRAIDLDTAKLPEFLDRECAGDGELRSFVEELLRADQRSFDALDKPALVAVERSAGDSQADTDGRSRPAGSRTEAKSRGDSSASPEVPPFVPGYEILGELGRGGMGIVYKARQVRADRLVAVKVLSGRSADDPEQVQRFRTEAESVARLQHPNIVQVFEVGDHEGRPFFSLEFCAGGNLAEYLSGTPMAARQVAELGVVLARAVHAAHEAKVLHRDLKPANVLLAEPLGADGGRAPIDAGLVKVTDFGLAKKLDDSTLTRTGMILGTPSYMAPEQAEGEKGVGPAADVYALGAILYQCSTGRPPFNADSPMATLVQVLEDEPVSPRRLQPGLPRDLETICLKCLDKEPGRRFGSADELGDDLQRFLDGEPILARPVGVAGRLLRWAKRRPGVAVLAGVTSLALVVMAAMGVYFTARLATATSQTHQVRGQLQEKSKEADAERRAKDLALRVQDDLRHVIDFGSYSGSIAEARRAWGEAEAARARVLLGQTAEAQRGWEYGYLARSFHGFGESRTFGDPKKKGGVLAFSADGKRLVLAQRFGPILFFDPSTGKRIDEFDPKTPATSLALNSSGQRLALGDSRDRSTKVWDLGTRKVVLRVPGPSQRTCLSPDGKLLAVAGRPVVVWEIETGEKRSSFGHNGRSFMSFTPTGDFLSTVDPRPNGKVRVWNTATGEQSFEVDGYHFAAFSPDGRRLVCKGSDFDWKLWDVAGALAGGGRPTLVESIPAGRLTSFAVFSADGNRLAFDVSPTKFVVWDVAGRWAIVRLSGDFFSTHPPVFSPDGKRLAHHSNGITLWNLEKRETSRSLTAPHRDPPPPGPVRVTLGYEPYTDVSLGPEGKLIALAVTRPAAKTQKVSVQNLETGKELFQVKGVLAEFGPKGGLLAIATQDHSIRLVDARTGEERGRLVGHAQLVTSLSFDRDGRFLASGSRDKSAKVWDLKTRRPVASFDHPHFVECVRLHPDGDRLATTALRDSTVRVWPVRGKGEPRESKGQAGFSRALAWSPDGSRLASAAGDVWLWDVDSDEEPLRIPLLNAGARSVAFTPDGKRLVLALEYLDPAVKQPRAEDGEGRVQLRDERTGGEVLTLTGLPIGMAKVAVSGDGRRLAVAHRHSVTVWDSARPDDGE